MAIKITGVNIIDDGFNILNLAKISAGASFGTAGQVLTSGGPSANVSWAAVSTGTGRLLRAPQVLTSGTSYTTPAGCTGIYVEAVGAGGGIPSVGSTSATGGGGSGGYCAKYFTVTASTAYTYAVGAGVAGGNGGNSTFTVGATTITAVGGRLAGGGSGADGGRGGWGINGDLNANGSIGTGAVSTTRSGFGGSSFFGAGGGIPGTTADGGFPGGGADGGTLSSAKGGNGLIRVWEFA